MVQGKSKSIRKKRNTERAVNIGEGKNRTIINKGRALNDGAIMKHRLKKSKSKK